MENDTYLLTYYGNEWNFIECGLVIFLALFCIWFGQGIFVMFVPLIKSKLKVYSFSGSLCIIATNHHSLEKLHQNWLSCVSATEACIWSHQDRWVSFPIFCLEILVLHVNHDTYWKDGILAQFRFDTSVKTDERPLLKSAKSCLKSYNTSENGCYEWW